MIRTHVVLLGCLVAFFGFAGAALAQGEVQPVTPVVEPAEESSWTPPEELPSSEEVLKRYVEVSGGKDAIEAQRNRRLVGMIRNDESGFRARVTLRQQRPNYLHMSLFIPGAGTQVVVFDGEIGWERQPDGGYRLLEGGRLRDVMTNAHFAGELDWETFLTDHETVGYTEVDGVPCVRVRATAFTGREMFLLFGVEHGLLIGRQTYQSIGAGGDVLQLMLVARYEVVGGVSLPRTIIQRTVQGDTIIDYDSYEVNLRDFREVERPDEVVTLIEARDAFGSEGDE